MKVLIELTTALEEALRGEGFKDGDVITLPSWATTILLESIATSNQDWLHSTRASLELYRYWQCDEHAGHYESSAYCSLRKAGMYQQGTILERAELAVQLRWRATSQEMRSTTDHRQLIWAKIADCVVADPAFVPEWFVFNGFDASGDAKLEIIVKK